MWWASPSRFDQNVAGLSPVKLIRNVFPDVQIVLGWTNFHGEAGSEHFRTFPLIDSVVIEEKVGLNACNRASKG